MDPITIDGLEEDDFRCSIEALLREGEADSAAGKLRALIEPHAGDGRILPARFLSVSAADVVIHGWRDLDNRLGKYDRPGHWVSAIGISIVDPREAEAVTGTAPAMSPCIETAFYSDDAWPFSRSDRNDLLEGYTRQGAEWLGNFEQADMTLSVTGLEDLFAAVAELEDRLLASEAPDNAEILAGSLGACYLSVLLNQAVRDKIRSEGLPRPLCVTTGCVGVYPFFDAPAISAIECIDGGFLGMEELVPAAQVQTRESVEAAAEADETYGSLLSLTGRMAKKKMVIELNEEDSAAATRQFEMAGAHRLAEAGEAPPRTGGTDFSAYAFDEEPPTRDEADDDWADIPDSPPSPESGFDREMDEWFGHSAEDRDSGPAEDELAFPSTDVSGWNSQVPAAEQDEDATDTVPEEFRPDPDFEEDHAFLMPRDVPHPDEAGYIPPPPPVGHGLRARLALTVEPAAAEPQGLFGALHRALAWFRRRWF